MAFGMRVSSGDFLPVVKYDARAGKLFKVDRNPGGTSDQIELPLGTKFALDIGSFEAGYVAFGAQGPDRRMKPYVEGQMLPAQPQDKDQDGKFLYRPGFYAKIAGNAIDGVREWCSNAASLLTAMDDLWQVVTKTPEAAAGKIPVISITSTTPIKSGTGAKSSTNYAPIFRVEGWVDRPDVLGTRTVPLPGAVQQAAPVAPVQQAATSSSAATPPADMPF